MKKLFTIATVLALFLTGCDVEPVANFTYSPANPAAGQEIAFNNLSINAESYEWNFDDGIVTPVDRPTHTFTSDGTYTVQLKAFGKRGDMSVYETDVVVFTEQPTAEFGVYTYLNIDDEATPVETDIVFVGEQVELYNTSLDALTYEWDLGDGYTTTEEIPIVTYDTPGTYTVTLTANNFANEDSYSKTFEVVEGVNSALRITVLEFYDEYPVEDAGVILFETLDDWVNQNNPSVEIFTTALGKCVFEGLNYQEYYVDVFEEFHDNYLLAEESADWITTQVLEPGYIYDFTAYVDYYAPDAKKSIVLDRVSKKKLAKEIVSTKKSAEYRTSKQVQFTKKR